MGEISTVSSLQGMLANVNVKQRFNEMLGAKAAGFTSSILTVVNGNKALQACDPKTILSAASIAATLDLPINPNLGFAALVPYKTKIDNKYVDVCQFQMMQKGFVQLAMRTSQYQAINASEVYEGEMSYRNRITGEMQFDFDARTSDKIIGYCSYMKMTNGYEKYFYMTVEEIEKHAKRYSKTYQKGFGKWKDDFHAMALKTVIKLLISKWGIMSIDMVQMQTALSYDQSVVKELPDGSTEPEYGDNTIDINIEPEPFQQPEMSEAEKEYALFKEKQEGTKK